jgi:hypothetical protein
VPRDLGTPPAVALVIPLATDEIAYSPATEHETVLRVPFTGYTFNTIPAELGYGSRGAGGVIKGGETLVFVVDLISVR